jgi:FkbM family methyltransferase
MNTEKLLPRLLSKLSPLLRRFARPEVLSLALRGQSVAMYVGLRQPWLQRLGFQTIVDIGANEGQFARVARMAFPHAALHCFEPLPDCFAKLQGRFGRARRVTIHNVALADRNGTSSIIRSPYSPSSSLLEMAPGHIEAFPFTEGGDPMPVAVLTLDAALAGERIEEPLLVKVDVQGAEDRVIAGGRSVLARARVVIIETSFEPLYKGQALFHDIHEMMRGLQFSYHGNLDQLSSPEDGRVLQGDAIFVRSA